MKNLCFTFALFISFIASKAQSSVGIFENYADIGAVLKKETLHSIKQPINIH